MSPLLLLLLGLLLLLLCGLRGRNRRDNEPPLINGWIPFIGKALEFGRDAGSFLEEQRKKFGDIFTVHIAGKYMTFIMDPLMYPSIIKHGRQLDFHELSDMLVPVVFGYPPLRRSPGLSQQIQRSFQLLQGDHLGPLTESMMGNLLLLLRQDHLGEDGGGRGGWKSADLLDFCSSLMFEATFLTIYGQPPSGRRHGDTELLRSHFLRFDAMFPLLIAKVPIELLRQAKTSRQSMIRYFLPHRMSSWSHTSQFIRTRAELLDQYEALKDADKAAHHFAILWASVANTVPACFWAVYFLLSHQGALQRVLQEIQEVLQLGGAASSSQLDLLLRPEQLDQLLHLDSSIRETLRLSSASMNVRVAQQDFLLQLPGRCSAVRKGDIIALYPQSLHLDPEVYPEPQTFQHDRFLQDGRQKTDFYKRGQRLRYFLMPFGSGASMCPGRFFAINEIKQLVILLLLHLELQLEEGQRPPSPDPRRAGLGIMMPREDVRFRYRPRPL